MLDKRTYPELMQPSQTDGKDLSLVAKANGLMSNLASGNI